MAGFNIRQLCLSEHVSLAAFFWLMVSGLQAAHAAMPSCPPGREKPYPPFAEVGKPPNVASWQELSALPVHCHLQLISPAALTVALAGRFNHAGSVEEIANRLGAISETRGLSYWSVTDEKWRTLISDAFALDSADADSARPDFSAQEILSGEALYFAQNDTRSWGLNVYRIRAINTSERHLIIESENVAPVRLGPVTLFEPGEVRSVLFIDPLNETTWSYFSLSSIRRGALTTSEKSLINRQAAFYRFLIGHSTDQEPPLAP